jgi:hypothetical protein
MQQSTDGAPMPKVSDITAVHITLEIDGKQSLFVLLSQDGTVNRLGTGAVNNAENDLFIGISSEPLIEQAKQSLTDDMLDHMGGYDVPDQKGASCKLSIGFQFADGGENGFGFSYGSESQGPPQEITQFVVAAVEATEPWYQSQKKMTGGGGSTKPWWKFW